jgi:hypothetical protein
MLPQIDAAPVSVRALDAAVARNVRAMGAREVAAYTRRAEEGQRAVAAAASNARLTQALARECIACMHAWAARLWWHVDVCELPRAFSFVSCSLYTECVCTSVPTQSWGQYRHQVQSDECAAVCACCANVQWMTPVSLHRSMPTFDTSPRTFLAFLRRCRPPSLTDAGS